MIHLTLVTQSAGKLAEIERILGQSVDHYEADLPEIQSVEVEDVVISKAIEAYKMLHRPIMIEDTGLFIDAWNGLPGALIKWFVQRVKEPGICQMMKDYPNRKAWAKTVVATFDGSGEPVTYVGQVEGQIAFKPAGQGGFGWDKVFIPDGATMTFGEMPPDTKDKYSMRYKAFKQLLDHYS
jgi:non-canonical purine NTP pyrophosphatase (RdgB/HAM1 family)